MVKTGIVLEIGNNKAVIMQTGGSFIACAAKEGWSKGSVVSVKNNHFSIKSLYAIAACFILVFLLSIGGVRIYFTEASIVSIDINPSFEMSLNRFDKVIRASGYNDDSLAVLNTVNFLHKSYTDAIVDLLTSEALSQYLLEGEIWIKISVYSNISEKNNVLSEAITKKIESLSTQDCVFRVDCVIVTRELIKEAHEHGLTPGKYSEILELVKLFPDTDIDDYRDMSIKEIRVIKEPIINEQKGDDPGDKVEPIEEDDLSNKQDDSSEQGDSNKQDDSNDQGDSNKQDGSNDQGDSSKQDGSNDQGNSNKQDGSNNQGDSNSQDTLVTQNVVDKQNETSKQDESGKKDETGTQNETNKKDDNSKQGESGKKDDSGKKDESGKKDDNGKKDDPSKKDESSKPEGSGKKGETNKKDEPSKPEGSGKKDGSGKPEGPGKPDKPSKKDEQGKKGRDNENEQ